MNTTWNRHFLRGIKFASELNLHYGIHRMDGRQACRLGFKKAEQRAIKLETILECSFRMMITRYFLFSFLYCPTLFVFFSHIYFIKPRIYYQLAGDARITLLQPCAIFIPIYLSLSTSIPTIFQGNHPQHSFPCTFFPILDLVWIRTGILLLVNTFEDKTYHRH